MKPSEALRLRREEVRRILASHRAANPRIFGSVLHGRDEDGSDLDLLVDVPLGTTLLDLARLQGALQDALGVPVDVLTAGDLPPWRREHILRESASL